MFEINRNEVAFLRLRMCAERRRRDDWTGWAIDDRRA
jgi:hypothetical protein